MSLPLVRAAGDHYQLGRAHGEARAAELQAFLADGLARLDPLLAAPTSLADLSPTLAAYDARITAAVPGLAEEITGLADGAAIDREQALLLQLRRELTGYQRIPSQNRPATQGDCTTYAEPGLLAQTVDLNGNLDDQITILDLDLTGGRHSLVLSFGGLLGYLGLNSDGLAIGLNLVLGGDWGPGVPPYLAIRHLLDVAGSVAEAVAELRRLPLASSRSLTLCDPRTAVCLEILDNEIVEVGRGRTAHTNHFLDPNFAGRDELNVFARNSSQQRLRTALAARAGAGSGSVVDHFDLLATAPICVADTGDIRRERTVAAVVLEPGRGVLHIRPGNPSLNSTESFSFHPAERPVLA